MDVFIRPSNATAGSDRRLGRTRRATTMAPLAGQNGDDPCSSRQKSRIARAKIAKIPTRTAAVGSPRGG
jgi:hypothetical protein